jgi:regulator of replication initiation timing
MSRVGHELGMPFNKAQRQLFERMEAAEHQVDYLHQVNEEGVKINAVLRDENDKLRNAIVGLFARAYGKEK